MKRIFVLLMTILFASVAFGDALDISKLGYGARSIALGRAQVAAMDDASVFINPANAAAFKTIGLTSMYTNLIDDIGYTMLGGVFPLREGDLGCISVGYLGAGVSGIAVTSSETRTAATSTTDYSSRILSINYSRKANSSLNYGIGLKFSTKSFEKLQSASATGISLDLGLIFYPQNALRFGLSAQNIVSTRMLWASTTKENIPINIKMGLNYDWRKDIKILADYDSSRNAHAGIEWLPKEFLALRGGLDYVPTGATTSALNFTMGLGLMLKGIEFDYAYYMDSLIAQNSTHYFSLSYNLAPKTVEVRPIVPASTPANIAVNSTPAMVAKIKPQPKNKGISRQPAKKGFSKVSPKRIIVRR